MLYGTTQEFLRVFGLASLSDLPQAKELRPG
jgi:chromosome segregation and condensation protein ScpB